MLEVELDLVMALVLENELVLLWVILLGNVLVVEVLEMELDMQ